MHLNQAQKDILDRIEKDPAASSHFDFICAQFTAAFDEDMDPEKTDPVGVSTASRVEIDVAARAVAAAWLEMVARAVTDHADELSPILFDEDGVARFSGSHTLFEIGRACGLGEQRLRRAIAYVRQGARIVPRRAMKILGSIRAIVVPKRKLRYRGGVRIKALTASLAKCLDACEIARAKAGSVIYALVARKGGYEAVRMHRAKAPMAGGGVEIHAAAPGVPIEITDLEITQPIPLQIVSEMDVHVMEGFAVDLVPCEGAHGIALAQFIQFLDGEGGRTAPRRYGRLVHRPLAA